MMAYNGASFNSVSRAMVLVRETGFWCRSGGIVPCETTRGRWTTTADLQSVKTKHAVCDYDVRCWVYGRINSGLWPSETWSL
jgi:hypothetical protein